VVYKADGKQQDTRILNREGGLSGVVTNDNHLPIPSSDFPRDERFFGNGVSIAEIREDSRPPRMVYDPSHPDADAKGYVAMPNINVVQEMTDMISASRAYEANVTAFNATKSMLTQATQL
jgi:flagellar basal-body rod protein FlgC